MLLWEFHPFAFKRDPPSYFGNPVHRSSGFRPLSSPPHPTSPEPHINSAHLRGDCPPCWAGNPTTLPWEPLCWVRCTRARKLAFSRGPRHHRKGEGTPACYSESCGIWRVPLTSPWGGGGRPASLETLRLRGAAPVSLRLGGVPALWRKPHHPEGVPTPSTGKRVPRDTLETPCTGT